LLSIVKKEQRYYYATPVFIINHMTNDIIIPIIDGSKYDFIGQVAPVHSLIKRGGTSTNIVTESKMPGYAKPLNDL
jgi:hypothetical protein